MVHEGSATWLAPGRPNSRFVEHPPLPTDCVFHSRCPDSRPAGSYSLVALPVFFFVENEHSFHNLTFWGNTIDHDVAAGWCLYITQTNGTSLYSDDHPGGREAAWLSQRERQREYAMEELGKLS